MTSPPLRLGILGCGRIVTRRTLPAALQSQAVQVTAIASERAGVAGETARQFGIPAAFDSYDAILASDCVEAVYVPTSGDQHARWTIAAAQAGKHVLCEKPLAPTVAEARDMIANCETQGVLLQEAFMWRHHPRSLTIREMLRQGAIGKLRLITVHFSLNMPRDDWRLRPERGGGAMWDLGCYGVNASRFFADAEPVQQTAAAHWAETGVDLTMRIGLTFPSEVLANIDCSFEAPFRCYLELLGDAGRIVVDSAFQPAENPIFYFWKSAERDVPVEVVTCPTKNQYAAQLEDFAAGVRAGRLILPAENGWHNMLALEAILASAQAHRLPA